MTSLLQFWLVHWKTTVQYGVPDVFYNQLKIWIELTLKHAIVSFPSFVYSYPRCRGQELQKFAYLTKKNGSFVRVARAFLNLRISFSSDQQHITCFADVWTTLRLNERCWLFPLSIPIYFQVRWYTFCKLNRLIETRSCILKSLQRSITSRTKLLLTSPATNNTFRQGCRSIGRLSFKCSQSKNALSLAIAQRLCQCFVRAPTPPAAMNSGILPSAFKHCGFF